MKIVGLVAGLLMVVSAPLSAETLTIDLDIGGLRDHPRLTVTTPQSAPVSVRAAYERSGSPVLLSGPALADLLGARSLRPFEVDDAIVLLPEAHALLQRTRARPARQASSGDPVLKWVGVGLMVVGGLGALNSVAWCGVGAVCTTPLIVYGGAAGFGWYLFSNNR